jgi:hypothetical protein
MVTLDLHVEARSMEYMELLFSVFTAILAVFVAVFPVVFLFLQQRWFQSGQGDAHQEKEKTAAGFVFAESKFLEKAMVSQRRRFDLLVDMPEKILDQIMDVVNNVPGEDGHPLQVRVVGRSEAIPDVGQHAGLLSFCPSCSSTCFSSVCL